MNTYLCRHLKVLNPGTAGIRRQGAAALDLSLRCSGTL